MIPGEVTFLRPESLSEAAAAFVEAEARGLVPLYYGGGTEILSLARQGKVTAQVLIDLKSIAECRELCREDGEIVVGAALSLNEIIDSGLYPLLGAAAARVADHTVRNRLSLGGNLAGRLPYRETVLPLLVAEAHAELYGPGGLRREPVGRVFSRRLTLERGEFLVRVRVGAEALAAPHYHGRRERGPRVDYPLVTVCLLRVGSAVRLAVSGACGYPLRLEDLQIMLGESDPADCARAVVAELAGRIKGDFRASGEFRSFLLEELVREGIEGLCDKEPGGTG